MALGLMARNPQVRIKNYTGVPVLDITGELNADALRQIAEQVQRLVDAGHYHIVFNLKRAVIAGIRGLKIVNDIAGSVRRHYGSLYIIADRRVQDELRHARLAEGTLLCRSEEHAVAKILGGYYRPIYGRRGVPARFTS